MNPASPSVSIILCSFERTRDLLATLESIRRVRVPAPLSAELIVVDNSRTEDTRRALHERFEPIPHLPLRVLHEPHQGKSHALNRGLAAAQGEVLLFTDNDVRVPSDWIEGMARPILAEETDAVAGGVHLAPELCRPWMEPFHRGWLASTEVLNPAEPEALIGANMAFSRRVLERVPAFDLELGPGSVIGSCEESLFSFQLRAAGYRIASAFHVSVEHRFEAARLTRQSFLRRARIEGSGSAYIAHHWRHEPVTASYREWLVLSLKLAVKRWLARASLRAPEGAPMWEIYRLMRLHFIRQSLRERHRPSNYAKLGLVKLRT